MIRDNAALTQGQLYSRVREERILNGMVRQKQAGATQLWTGVRERGRDSPFKWKNGMEREMVSE